MRARHAGADPAVPARRGPAQQLQQRAQHGVHHLRDRGAFDLQGDILCIDITYVIIYS